MIAAARIAEVMGGVRVLHHRIVTLAELDEVVARGLPRAALDALVRRVVDPPESVRLKYRIVPKATYLRQERLNVAHSQKAERLARVFAMAEAIWQDEAAGASVHEHAASRAGRPDPARRRHDRDRRTPGRGGARTRVAWPPRLRGACGSSGSQAPPIRSSTAAALAVSAVAGAAPGAASSTPASAYALALLENLVHWNTTRLPLEMRFVVATIPATVSRSRLVPEMLPGWDRSDYRISRPYGDAWYDRGESAVLIVPSILSPFEPNVLINQAHVEARGIELSEELPALFDRRLIR